MNKKRNIKRKIKKIWNFLWHDDSILSWAVNIMIAFILVKFVIYPGLGAVFGTSLPVVAVVSGSMDHDGSFDEWWTPAQEDFYLKKFITKQQFQLYPLKNGFSKGDVIILTGANTSKLKKGEVIVFSANKQYPIIHRIVDIHEDGTFETKGDGNSNQAYGPELNELEIKPEQILGKAQFRIPWIGWLKIGVSCGWNTIINNPNIPGRKGFTACLSYQA